MSEREPRERVELVEGEHVVARGSARTHWFVRVRDAWVRVGDVPGACVRSLDPGPGTVWEHRVELELPRGARLLCVRSFPRPITKTPLEYLQASTETKRRVLRTYHSVRRGGLVVRETPEGG